MYRKVRRALTFAALCEMFLANNPRVSPLDGGFAMMKNTTNFFPAAPTKIQERLQVMPPEKVRSLFVNPCRTLLKFHVQTNIAPPTRASSLKNANPWLYFYGTTIQ